jgi:predicted Zn finger-like uncharacterized protein
MRLICPNCSAQYEIDVNLIPDEGRDVQCSNCGHTWFELPPAAKADESAGQAGDAPEPETFDAPAQDATDDAEAEEEAPSNAAKAIAAATDDVADDREGARADSEPFKDVDDPFEAAASEFSPKPNVHTDMVDEGDDENTQDGAYEQDEDEKHADDDIDLSAIAPTTLKARRPADAADTDLLREEANRELSQRRAKPSEALESQTELGLDSLTNRKTPSRALRARMARSSGNETTFEDTEPASEADYQAPQRDLLPDIDEINSTLRQDKTDGTQDAPGRSGFRFGFGMMLFLCVAAILAYAFAPDLANAVPGAEPALLRFVDVANQLRDWIDGLLA